ncbi:M20/M25/M40 family metallo-hydrolase [Pseudonocardia endophytica]|nr:M20/M25/M40 family metallo-hydrolase [Pseudonocardia endophytica]
MGGMAARFVSVLVLVLVGAFAFVDAGPPSPVPASAGPGEFSAERAKQTVAELAREPRPIGSPASDRTRDELVRRLDAAGLDTRIQSSAGAFAKNGSMSAGAVENVVATLPGTDPTGAIVLAAHYDSVARGPGAADDMSSVASILEAVRALRTGPPLRNDIVVLITDGEESGLLGAQAWVRDELVADRRPVVTLNFEARGVSGPSLMFQTSPGNDELVRTYADALPHPTGDSSLVEFYRLLPNDTDFTNVLRAGRPGLNFAFIDQPTEYHTTGDNPSNLDAGSVQGHGDAALGLTRALGDRDLAPLDPGTSGAPETGDRTYFRFLGGMVTYPGWFVWPVAGLAAVALAGAIVLGRRGGLMSIRGTLGAAGATLLVAGAGLGAAIGLWQLITLVRPSYADTGPFLARPLVFQLADVALVVAVVALWLLLLRRRPGRYAAAAGACLVFTVLGLVTAFATPGMSFLFAWPALGLALGLGVAILLRERPAAATAAVTVGAIPAVVLLVPFGWAAFALSGISDGLPVVVLVLTLAALTAVLVPTSTSGRRRWVPVGALVLTLVLAGAAMLVDRPSSEHPQATSLAFVQDADTGVATWVSEDTAPADWTRRYVSSPPTRIPAWTDDVPVRTGPAPALPVPGPAVTVVERTPDRVVLQVASPRGAPTVQVRSDRPLESVTVVHPGRPPASASPDGSDVRLSAVPATGVRVTLTPVEPGPVGLQVSDVSDGLGAVPGFVPRPPELRGEANRTSDQVLVTRRIPG